MTQGLSKGEIIAFWCNRLQTMHLRYTGAQIHLVTYLNDLLLIFSKKFEISLEYIIIQA